MSQEGKSWLDGFGPFGRSHLATQAAVLLPVMVIAGLCAWTMGAWGQSVEAPAALATLQRTPPSGSEPTSAEVKAAPPVGEISPIAGLKISSQSWRRGGLGSNALFNLTLRNGNDYAVGDIEVACSFSRRDGSQLTERRRVIPEAVVNMKSRKTFARVHIGFVNINANKAKCAVVAASRI